MNGIRLVNELAFLALLFWPDMLFMHVHAINDHLLRLRQRFNHSALSPLIFARYYLHLVAFFDMHKFILNYLRGHRNDSRVAGFGDFAREGAEEAVPARHEFAFLFIN